MKTKLGILFLAALLAAAVGGCARKAAEAEGGVGTVQSGGDQVATGRDGLPSDAPGLPGEGETLPDIPFFKNDAAAPYGARPDPRTEKPGSHDPEWKPQATAALQIAQRADEALRNLEGVHGAAQMTMTLPEGTATATGEMKIRSRDTYQLTFIDFENGFPKNARAVADGRTRTILGERIVHKPIDRPDPAPPTPKLMEEWAKELPRRAVSGFLERRTVFSEYVEALSRPGSGYTVRTEVRKMMLNDVEMPFHRIVATRTPEAVAKDGPHTIELIFDGDKNLPVLIHTRLEPKGELPTEIRWQAGWRGEQRFEDSDFVVPKATS
jgi:hypothetical protein